MASMRDIKRRRGSIQSTQQITKAMKLVSTVKLQKAKARAEASNPYFTKVYSTVCDILARTQNISHPYLNGGGSGKKAIIVITSNRGLAGGYNSNVCKLIGEAGFAKDDVVIYGVGHKGIETLARRGYEIAEDYSEVIAAPTFKDADMICKVLLERFAAGEISEIHLAYTHFKNTVSHEPKLMQLLPVKVDADETQVEAKPLLMNYEQGEEEALNAIIPSYLSSLIYGAFIEAVASENGARMQAMDSATSNAEEMISDLSLKYNRARQSHITQELTEIVAGAEAIS